MTAHIFAIYSVLALVAGAVAFLPLSGSRAGKGWKRLLYIGCALTLVPIVVKMIFCVFPLLEARIMPITVYGAMQGEFWLPFSVLFFGLASHLVPPRERRGAIIMMCAFVFLVIQQTFWHLGKPEAYHYRGTIEKGVCLQSSDDTCGSASMVTLLNAIGIQATEGEMARLSVSAPGRGLSPHQAGYALRRKLRRLKRRQRVTIEVPGRDGLCDLPLPFLAGIRYSFWTNHMVCVLDVDEKSLLVGDPLIGRRPWSCKRFEREWTGIVVTVHYK
jgi:hypothetical protein